MKKNYKLLKPLPAWYIGTYFQQDEKGDYCPVPWEYPKFSQVQMDNNPDWFEEVKETEKPKRKAPAYLVNVDKSDWGITSNIYSSLEEAIKAYDDWGYEVVWPALPDSEGYYPGPEEKS